MKQIQFFALVSAFIVLASCGSEKPKKDEVKEETPPNVPVVKKGDLKIAYYNQDTLKTQFEVYTKEEARITKKTKDYQNQMIAREKELQRLGESLQNHAKMGDLLPDQLGRMENDFNRKQQQYMSYQQQQAAKLDEETNNSLIALNKKIEAASKKYCEKYGIDVLLIQAQGGQIGFINTKMDVTESFVDFLNKTEADLEKGLGK